MLNSLKPLKPAPEPAKHNAIRQRVDVSINERIACAVEAMAAAFLQSSSGQASRPKLMSYEEATEVTRLGRSTLESMVNSGRFREGRHFIKEGSRVLFHPDLLDRMFEDKLSSQDDDGTSTATSKTVPETQKATPPLSQPRNGSSINLNYRYKGELRAALLCNQPFLLPLVGKDHSEERVGPSLCETVLPRALR